MFPIYFYGVTVLLWLDYLHPPSVSYNSTQLRKPCSHAYNYCLITCISFLQVVLMENASLKAEIRKLRIENNDLLRKVRFADTNAHYMRVSPQQYIWLMQA